MKQRTSRALLLGIPSLAAALMAACGGSSDGSTAPAPAANAKYQGVFASGSERGTISLQAGSPATGSLVLGTSPAVALTGSYTAATSAFALSGGGYAVQGTAANNAVTGTVSGTGINGTGTMSAVSAATAEATTRYCGVFMGGDAGMADIIVSGGVAAASITGMGGGFGMFGTASGSSVTLSVTGKEPGTGKTNTITARLTVSGSTISGSGSSTLYPNDNVTVTASTSGCVAAAAAGPFTSYVGFAGNNGVTGLLQLNATSPATGSIKWNGGTTTALSGTYDAATGKFAVTGTDNVTITATASGMSLTGAISGPPKPYGGASVWAMGANAATPVSRYCGATAGGLAGTVILLSGGSNTLGLWINSGGSILLNGSGGNGWVYAAGGTQMYFAATGSGASYAGTYAHVNGAAGSWSVSGC